MSLAGCVSNVDDANEKRKLLKFVTMERCGKGGRCTCCESAVTRHHDGIYICDILSMSAREHGVWGFSVKHERAVGL